jgi:hypothetical protein
MQSLGMGQSFQFSGGVRDQGLLNLALGQGASNASPALNAGNASSSMFGFEGPQGPGGWGQLAQRGFEEGVEGGGWGGGALQMPLPQHAGGGGGYVDDGLMAYDQQQ